MHKLSDDEIPKLSYGDAGLVSLNWRVDGAEPTFIVTLNRLEWGVQRTITLAFTWPYVDIELNSRYGFEPFSWQSGDDSDCQRLEDGRWKLTLDFAHQGAIYITCNDVYREVV